MNPIIRILHPLPALRWVEIEFMGMAVSIGADAQKAWVWVKVEQIGSKIDSAKKLMVGQVMHLGGITFGFRLERFGV